MVTGDKGVGHVGPGPARPDGDAVTERLGHGDDIGLDAEVLEPEPAPGAGESGLHLVEHEQDTALVAQLADSGDVLGIGRIHAAFALQRFEQDRGDDVGVNSIGEGVEVVEGHVAEAFGQRLERLVLGGLARGVQRRQGPAVEAAVGRDDGVDAVPGPLASQLQGAFVGLGPAVGEEHPAAAAEEAVEGGGDLGPHGIAIKVGHVQQRPGLLGDGIGHTRVRMAERCHAQPAEEVEVALAGVVPQPAALAPHERHRWVGVGGHERVGTHRSNVLVPRTLHRPATWELRSSASLRSSLTGSPSCRCPRG